MGTELLEVEKRDGEEILLEVPDYVDGKTQKKIMQDIKMKTKIKNGETEHIVEDSAAAAQKMTDTLIKRALKLGENDGIGKENLSQSAKNKVVEYYGDKLQGVEAEVKKK